MPTVVISDGEQTLTVVVGPEEPAPAMPVFFPTSTPPPPVADALGTETPTPEQTPEVKLVPPAAPSATGAGVVWRLTEAELRHVLSQAGWPAELHLQALAITKCESNWGPNSENGTSYGLFQLWPGWFPYAGEPFERWADPVVNARAAWAAYQYDLARGHAPWAQWTCQP